MTTDTHLLVSTVHGILVPFERFVNVIQLVIKHPVNRKMQLCMDSDLYYTWNLEKEKKFVTKAFLIMRGDGG